MNNLCPICKNSYPSDINFCPNDGARLLKEEIHTEQSEPEIKNPFERSQSRQQPFGQPFGQTFGQPFGQSPNQRYFKASIGDRFLALLIDSLIVIGLSIPAIIAFIFAFVTAYGNQEEMAILIGVLGVVLFLLPLCFQLLKDGFGQGQSPGKKVMKLMVIDLETNMPCTKGKSFLRNIIITLLGMVPFIGGLIEPIMVLATADGRRLGDRAANTMVIERSQYFS